MPVIDEIFKSLDKKYQQLIALSVVFTIVTIPISLAIIAINVSSLQFKNDFLQIDLKGKEEVNKLTNDAEYSTSKTDQRLANLEQQVERLKQQRPHDPLVKEVVNEFEEFKPTVKAQIEKTEELTDRLGIAIAK